MKKIIITSCLLLASVISVFASGNFTLSKSQQARLNITIKHLKVPTGDYKLTVTSTGITLSELESTMVISTGTTIIQEKIITVEKPVIIEKIVEKPMSQCVDISNVKPSTGGRISIEEMKLREEIEVIRLRNQMFGCP